MWRDILGSLRSPQMTLIEQMAQMMPVDDVAALTEAIQGICDKGKDHYTESCRKRAEELFDKDKCFEKYVKLYEGLIR